MSWAPLWVDVSIIVSLIAFVAPTLLSSTAVIDWEVCRGWSLPSSSTTFAALVGDEVGAFLLSGSLLCLLPALSHSPYGFGPLSIFLCGQILASWPSNPQLKQRPSSLSYLKATRTLLPSGLTTRPPLCSGFFRGISTHNQRKRAWSDNIALQLTSKTLLKPLPISIPASTLMRSKGSPQT